MLSKKRPREPDTADDTPTPSRRRTDRHEAMETGLRAELALEKKMHISNLSRIAELLGIECATSEDPDQIVDEIFKQFKQPAQPEPTEPSQATPSKGRPVHLRAPFYIWTHKGSFADASKPEGMVIRQVFTNVVRTGTFTHGQLKDMFTLTPSTCTAYISLARKNELCLPQRRGTAPSIPIDDEHPQ
jgi:hypothetical protein